MMASHVLLSKVCTSIAAFLLCSCSTLREAKEKPIPLASGSELLGVVFKPGRPKAEDSLIEALEAPEELENLQRDAKIINRLRTLKFRIVGNTDDRECAGSECMSLSVRRADYVRNWLINAGVPETSLKEPIGYGSTRPIQDNSIEEARRKNRNAFIEFEG